MRILIAEDNPATLHLLDALLRKWGYETVLARGGNEAWEILRAPGAPALVLLDWMMPDIDGIELCRNVRSLQAELRPYIILLTAKETKKDLVTGINAGADDYLTKPFEPDELRVRVHAGARIVEMEIDMLTARETLRHMATHDDMTGLLNRVFGMETLSREFARSARTGRPISIVLADLDQFKAISNLYGHVAADRALVQTAKRLSSKLRLYDVLVRYGRKEFLAVLYECDAPDAEKIAERLRRVLADEPFDVDLSRPVEGKKAALTASFGVASCSEASGAAIEDLLRLADNALCRAKADGRNRINVEHLLMAGSRKDEAAMMTAG
jgi:two-component system, cell cycle response regulator